MKHKSNPTIAIIISALNEEKTIVQTISSLAMQDWSSFARIDLIIIDDGSSDGTAIAAKSTYENVFVQKFSSQLQTSFHLIQHLAPKGLADSLNEGMALSQTLESDFILVSQSDILLKEHNVVEEMYKSLTNKELGATYPYVIHEKELWETYPFWQKVLLDRQLYRRSPSMFAKMALMRNEVIAKVGFYDSELTGGEDNDFFKRVHSTFKTEITPVEVIHIHNAAGTFSWQKLVYKEGQQAESVGALIRKYGLSHNLLDNLLVLFRPAIALLNFIPIVNFITVPVSILFFTLYAKNTIIFTFKKCWDYRILFVYPVMLYSLYVSLYSFFLGLTTGKVTIFRNK